jgi:type VI secretion system secreted protein Hcp
MAQNAYLKIVGKKTGEVKGSVTLKGQEGRIQVIAANHDVLSPRDPASGLPTGKRIHKPFVITKETDKSSPLLYNMLCTNEVITEWTLQFFATLPTGVQVQTHTVQLVNASIADIVFTMPNNKHPDLAPLVEYEDISFTYQRITWTWTDGGITASDDWSSPAV